MNRNRFTVSQLKNREMYWDNYFAHRIYGAIGLAKALIAKQAIALQGLNIQQSEYASNFDQSELAYVDECIKDYNQCLKAMLKEQLKKRKYEKLTDDEFEYGIDYKLADITELFAERVQRQIDLNLEFAEVIGRTHAKKMAIRLAVTGALSK